MTIKSMTGFARADGTIGATNWHWEVRSVNGRGLDIRSRLPPGYEGLEPRVRELVSKRISRGSISLNLAVRGSDANSQIRLNERALEHVLAALQQLKSVVDVAQPRADGLLGIKGVLEVVEPEEKEADVEARNQAMLAGLAEALDNMVRARAGEGRRLQTIIQEQLTSIERLVAGIAALPARSPSVIRERLKEQVGRLLETGINLDEARLYQEAALLGARADIEEELKRLETHIAGARELIVSSEPAGRRLDFLAQEFNREANTLCSKANDAETTKAGLELKSVIDQMREQVQNIE
jgi:uncharacterized protein (TIGR00255 family)